MSLLWRDRLNMALCPDRAIVLRFARGRLVSKDIHCFDAGSAIEALQGVLSMETKKSDATLVLSNHFVKYMVMPWTDAALSEEELHAMIRHRFTEVYGDSDWEVRLSGGSFGAPSLASAVDRDFLGKLKQAFESSSVRLKSVQPYLMAAFNASRDRMKAASSWFVMAEDGLCCIAMLRDGNWQRVRQCRGGLKDAQQMLEREALLAQDDLDRKVYVFSPQSGAWTEDGWTAEPLRLNPVPGISGVEADSYAMAMAGG